MLTSLHCHLLLLQRFVLLANDVAVNLREKLASFDGVLNVAIDFGVYFLLFLFIGVHLLLQNAFYGVHLLLFHAVRLTCDAPLLLLYVFDLSCDDPLLLPVVVFFFFIALLHLAAFIHALFFLVLQLLSVAFIVQLA